jgi:hypothetical protein
VHKLITESYWLLFDYIKPCLHPVPRTEKQHSDWQLFDSVVARSYDTDIEVSFAVSGNLIYRSYAEEARRLHEYRTMTEFLFRCRWSERGVTDIFSSRRTHAEYELFLNVLKNMILAGEIAKDRCVKILTEAENHEALVELLQFDAGEEPGRFEI